ncbi:MAG TPA: tetratricopeptide repeat protein [Caulobacteraceae bacterium]
MKTLRSLVVVLALGLAVPALAQVPLDGSLDEHSAKRLDRMEQAVRELRSIVFQGRETGHPVTVEPADTDAQMSALSQKIDDLQQAITRLTGQLESAGHDVDQARHEADQLREENGALTARVAALEQKLAAPPQAAVPPPAAAEETPPPPPLDAPAALAAAREAYNAGDYAAAEADFKDIVDRFGDTPRGMEARYFLAKLQLKRADYQGAAATDLAVVRQWPKASWAPDAALDLARAMVGMKEAREACGVLGEIDTHYPKAGAAVRTGAEEIRSQAGCAAG